MIWFLPVKASSMDEKDFFLLEEIEHKLLIIVYAIHVPVNFRENIETGFRFYS